jgi:hypothetical protein
VAHITLPSRRASVPKNGGPGAIRTPDPFVRSEVLYPTELRARRHIVNVLFQRHKFSNFDLNASSGRVTRFTTTDMAFFRQLVGELPFTSTMRDCFWLIAPQTTQTNGLILASAWCAIWLGWRQ